MSKETVESVFMGFPNGCVLKSPNNYNSKYSCVYKENTKNSVWFYGNTPREAVIKMAEWLANHPTKDWLTLNGQCRYCCSQVGNSAHNSEEDKG